MSLDWNALTGYLGGVCMGVGAVLLYVPGAARFTPALLCMGLGLVVVA